jgi:hypothetical protein
VNDYPSKSTQTIEVKDPKFSGLCGSQHSVKPLPVKLGARDGRVGKLEVA